MRFQSKRILYFVVISSLLVIFFPYNKIFADSIPVEECCDHGMQEWGEHSCRTMGLTHENNKYGCEVRGSGHILPGPCTAHSQCPQYSANRSSSSGAADSDEGKTVKNWGLGATAGALSGSIFTSNKTSNEQIAELIGSWFGVVIIMMGALVLILIFFGGFMWLTSQGNEEKVTKAKALLINSVIGLVIIACAYIIVYFVMDSLAGAVASSSVS